MNPAPPSRRRGWRILLGFGAFLFLLLAALWFTGARGLDSDLARLRARGEKLTYDELASPFLTNGAPRTAALVQLVNRLEPKPTGLGNVPTMTQVVPGRARVLAQAPALPLENGPLPWADLEVELAALEPELAKIRQLVEDPEPDLGLDPKQVFSAIRRPFIEKRLTAQLLQLEVIRHAHAGRRPEALASLHALVQTARLHRRDPTLVSQMINVAIAGLGLHMTWEVMQIGEWTEAQLAALQQDWESVDLLGAFELALMGERAAGLAYFDLAQHAGLQRLQQVGVGPGNPAPSTLSTLGYALFVPFYRALILPADQRLFLEVSQLRLDHLRLLRQGRSASTVQAELDALEKRLTRPFESWQRIRYPATSLVLPNTTRALQTTVRSETLRQLAIAALAIERHRLSQGAPPGSLDELVPSLLRSLPMDPMSGHPLRYHFQPDGSWRLWSVGDDGRDDGGEATVGPSTKPSASLSRMWGQGRDLVWPTPASADQVHAFEAEQARLKLNRSGGSSLPR